MVRCSLMTRLPPRRRRHAAAGEREGACTRGSQHACDAWDARIEACGRRVLMHEGRPPRRPACSLPRETRSFVLSGADRQLATGGAGGVSGGGPRLALAPALHHDVQPRYGLVDRLSALLVESWPAPSRCTLAGGRMAIYGGQVIDRQISCSAQPINDQEGGLIFRLRYWRIPISPRASRCSSSRLRMVSVRAIGSKPPCYRLDTALLGNELHVIRAGHLSARDLTWRGRLSSATCRGPSRPGALSSPRGTAAWSRRCRTSSRSPVEISQASSTDRPGNGGGRRPTSSHHPPASPVEPHPSKEPQAVVPRLGDVLRARRHSDVAVFDLLPLRAPLGPPEDRDASFDETRERTEGS